MGCFNLHKQILRLRMKNKLKYDYSQLKDEVSTWDYLCNIVHSAAHEKDIQDIVVEDF